MPGKVLGQSDISVVDSDTVVYTVPTGTEAAFTVSLCNRNAAVVRVSLAIAATTSALPQEWIEYSTLVDANGVLERTGLVCEAGRTVIVRSDTTGVSVSVYGYEEAV